jgi:hypothetical protein
MVNRSPSVGSNIFPRISNPKTNIPTIATSNSAPRFQRFK